MPGVFPKRFTNIVTEVQRPSGAKESGTETIYTNSSLYMPPIEGIGASCGPMKFQPENSYLNLVDKVKDIGLNSILNIVSSSGLAPVQLDPMDVGLNTIMAIKRNRGAPSRSSSEKSVKPRVTTPHRRGAQTFTTSCAHVAGPVTSSSVSTRTVSRSVPQQDIPVMGAIGLGSVGVVGSGMQPYIPPACPTSMSTTTSKPCRPSTLLLTNTITSPMVASQSAKPTPAVTRTRSRPANNLPSNTSTAGLNTVLKKHAGRPGVAAGLAASKSHS